MRAATGGENPKKVILKPEFGSSSHISQIHQTNTKGEKVKKRTKPELCEANRFNLRSTDVVNSRVTKRVMSNILDLEMGPNAIVEASEGPI